MVYHYHSRVVISVQDKMMTEDGRMTGLGTMTLEQGRIAEGRFVIGAVLVQIALIYCPIPVMLKSP